MTLVVTRPGTDALAALHASISRAKAGDPLAPVTVVVPDNHLAVATRRRLALGELGPVHPGAPGIAAVDFVTVYRLAELLGASRLGAQRRRPAATAVVAAAVRRALDERPGVFAPVATHPTTEQRLVRAHRELGDLSTGQLAALARCSARAADVVRIHRRVRAILSPHWYEERDLVDAATDALTGGLRPDLGEVVIHTVRDLSIPRARLLTGLSAVRATTVIATMCGAPDADRSTRVGLERLGMRPPAPDSVPRPVRSADTVPPTPRLRSTSDADDEVRHVLSEIVDATEAGVRYDEMAIVFATPDPYARLVHEHLAGAGVPVNGTSLSTIGERVAGRSLRRLLRIGERGLRREDVMDLLASSPVRWRGGAVPAQAWDRLSREAGIVAGATHWHERLQRFAEDRRIERRRLGDDPEWEWRARVLDRRIGLADSLDAFITDLASRLAAGADAATWTEATQWARGLVDGLVPIDESWPDDERRARDRVVDILERLAALDAIEHRVDPAVFRRTLDLELEGGLGRQGSLGNGVLIGHPSLVSGLHLQRLWVLGMAEGTYPARRRDDSLLPDHERIVTGALATTADHHGADHRDLRSALAACEHGTVTLSWPRGDLRRSEARAPSRWLLEASSVVAPGKRPSPPSPMLPSASVDHVPSYVAGLLGGRTATGPSELVVRALAREGHSGARPHPLVGYDPVLGRGEDLLRSRRSSTLTRFDGLVGAFDGAFDPTGPGAGPTSATALESWATCPYRYFVRSVLGIDPLDTPEHRLRIDPLDRGSLVHTILERFVREGSLHRVPGPPDANGDHAAVAGEITPGWTAEDRARLDTIAREELDRAHARGLTGADLYWRRDQVIIMRDLRRFLVEDDARRRQWGLFPVAAELRFGTADTDAVPIVLPSRRTLSLRGSIDLVDIDLTGETIAVTDYKTGKAVRYRSDNPHRDGTGLQLVLYALAARVLLGAPDAAVVSNYWFVSQRGAFALEGGTVDDAVTQRVLDAVDVIVDGIAQGVFCAHPLESTRNRWIDCEWCDPDGLGVTDLRRRLLQLRDEPHVRAYLELAEPTLVPAPQLFGGDDPA